MSKNNANLETVFRTLGDLSEEYGDPGTFTNSKAEQLETNSRWAILAARLAQQNENAGMAAPSFPQQPDQAERLPSLPDYISSEELGIANRTYAHTIQLFNDEKNRNILSDSAPFVSESEKLEQLPENRLIERLGVAAKRWEENGTANYIRNQIAHGTEYDLLFVPVIPGDAKQVRSRIAFTTTYGFANPFTHRQSGQDGSLVGRPDEGGFFKDRYSDTQQLYSPRANEFSGEEHGGVRVVLYERRDRRNIKDSGLAAREYFAKEQQNAPDIISPSIVDSLVDIFSMIEHGDTKRATSFFHWIPQLDTDKIMGPTGEIFPAIALGGRGGISTIFINENEISQSTGSEDLHGVGVRLAIEG